MRYCYASLFSPYFLYLIKWIQTKFSNRGRSPAIIKTVAPRRAFPLSYIYIHYTFYPSHLPMDCKYILIYERPRFTLIAMNGNTIIGGNKMPRIDDRIRESAGGLDGLEYVTRLR